MKTTIIQLVGLGAILSVVGCSHTAPNTAASHAGVETSHRAGDKSGQFAQEGKLRSLIAAGDLIRISHELTFDPDGPTRTNGLKVTWELKNKDKGALRGNPVKQQQYVSWILDKPKGQAFSIIVPNKHDWDIHTGAWRDLLPPPFHDGEYGVADAVPFGQDMIVILRFLGTSDGSTNGIIPYQICIPSLPPTFGKNKVRILHTLDDFSMIDATMSWNGTRD